MWWGWGGFGGFGWIFFVFLLVFLSRVLFGGWGWGWGWRRRYWRYGGWGPYGYGYGDPQHAEEILRARLARGEIDEAEYERLLEVLRRQR